MIEQLVDRFFAEEATPHVRELLHDALNADGIGTKYFTFNIFNVILDFEARSATIEDELDAYEQQVISFQELRGRLSEALRKEP